MEKLLSVQPNLFNFACMLTSDRDDAKDLLQDTTLRAIDNSDKYTANTNFKGWIFTIMRNIFINDYRRKARTNVFVDRTDEQIYLNMDRSSGFDTPEGTMAESEIRNVIDSFSDDYRVPFSMHLAGYKYVEIAEHTGLPLGTVKSRIFFARQKLMRRLQDYAR